SAGRCRFRGALEGAQVPFFSSPAGERRAHPGEPAPPRTRNLATGILGAPDSRRGGLPPSRGLHPYQPAETRPCRPCGGLAVFHVPPRGAPGDISAGLGGGCQRASVPGDDGERGERRADSALLSAAGARPKPRPADKNTVVRPTGT